MNNLVYAAMRFKELDSATAGDPELLIEHNKVKDEAQRHAVAMCIAAGGREIGEHESDLILEVPIDNANIIREIHIRIQNELDTATTIGVGDELADAKLALDWAMEHRPGTIKVMEPAIEQAKENSDDDDKFDYFEPESSVALNNDMTPIPLYRSEEETEDWADDKTALSDEMKQKIAGIIQMLQQKKQYIDSLKETNPEIYAGLVSVVQAISSMAAKAKQNDADKHSHMMTKIARHLDHAEGTTLEQEAAQVMEMLIEAQEQENKEKEFQKQALKSKNKASWKMARDRAEKTAKKHGIDKEFLAHLLR